MKNMQIFWLSFTLFQTEEAPAQEVFSILRDPTPAPPLNPPPSQQPPQPKVP